MEFHLVWLLLFLPIFIHSTDPQSSTERFNPEWHPQDAPEEPVQSSPPPDPALLLDVPKLEEPAPVNLDPVVTKNVESDSVSSSGVPEESSIKKILEAGKESKTEEIPEGEHEVESQIPATPSHVDGEEKTVEEELLSQERDNSQVPLADYSPPATMEPFVLLDGAEGGDGDKTEGRKDDEDNKTASKTEEIPSFSEWTKLQLLNKKQDAVLLQPNGVVNNKKEDGKNFASPDCGAKILLANPEAQNPSGLLSSSHDEYMLNRCGVSSWIIMELCERIRIEKIAMGNLELFSSSPKEVEVGVSDRFPTREWARVGPLELPDSRAVHSFPISGNYSYNKFVRVQILSHHGNEHYCPLSLIRVYGKSEYEEVLHEVTHADEDHMNHPESPLDEGTPIMEGTNEKSVIGSAADAVMNIVKKAVNVLGKRDNGDSSSSSTCQSITDCISTQPSQANVTEVCNWKDVSFVLDHSRYFNKEIINCHLLFQNYSIGAPGTVEGFWRAAFGEAILLTACNYETPTRNCSEPEPQVEAEQTDVEKGISNATIESNLTNNLTPPALSVKQTSENIQSTLDPNISTEPKQSTPAPVILVEEEAKTVQKESVFVRLTNKIKHLERNQSLSSGYLEELSQRFKKQSEESYSVSQGLKKNLNETLGKYKWLQEFTRRESSYLRRSVSDLRVTLWRTEMQRGFLILVAFVQFVGICIFCCWTRKKLSQLENKLNSQTSTTTTRPVQPRAGEQSESHPIIPRKRSNSHPELLKSKKKKKKKENSLKNSENIFTFIPQSATSPANLGLKNFSASNGILTNTNQLNMSPTAEFLVPYAPGSTPNSVNRFGILASPSVKTVNSLGGVSSTSAETLAAVAPIETITNGNRSGGSAGSLDSGSSTSTMSSKTQKKKMKFKNFIPKLFEK